MSRDQMPVFLIKAKDRLAIKAILYYKELCHREGLEVQAEEVGKAITEMVRWRARNDAQIKLPDHPHVSVSRDAPMSRARNFGDLAAALYRNDLIAVTEALDEMSVEELNDMGRAASALGAVITRKYAKVLSQMLRTYEETREDRL